MPQDDTLQHVRHVFGAVGGLLQLLVDLAPLDDLRGARLVLEELRDRLAVEVVGDVLQPVDLDAVGQNVAQVACGRGGGRSPAPA